MEELNIKSLSIPKIGCGLDGLYWNRVKEIIKDVTVYTYAGSGKYIILVLYSILIRYNS